MHSRPTRGSTTITVAKSGCWTACTQNKTSEKNGHRSKRTIHEEQVGVYSKLLLRSEATKVRTRLEQSEVYRRIRSHAGADCRRANVERSTHLSRSPVSLYVFSAIRSFVFSARNGERPALCSLAKQKIIVSIRPRRATDLAFLSARNVTRQNYISLNVK